MRTSNAPYGAAGLETDANCVSVLKVETSRLTGGAFRHFIKGIVRYEHSLEWRKTKGKLVKICKLLGRAHWAPPKEAYQQTKNHIGCDTRTCAKLTCCSLIGIVPYRSSLPYLLVHYY